MAEHTAEEVFLFLDTNLLLHYQRPDSIDWCTACEANTVRLVIYPLLMTEITKAKDMHVKSHMRERARKINTWLREKLADLSAPIRYNVYLHRDSLEPRDMLQSLGLDRNYQDDLIIASAASYQRQGRNVIVATSDGGLEMKLADFSLKHLSLDDGWKLAPETDPERARADKAEKAFRDIANRMPSFELPTNTLHLPHPPIEDADNYSKRKLIEVQAMFDQEIQKRQILSGFASPIFNNPANSPILTQLSDYFRAYWTWRQTSGVVRSVSLKIKNTGRGAATQLRVRLTPPDSINLYPLRAVASVPEMPFNLARQFQGLVTEYPSNLPQEILQPFRHYPQEIWNFLDEGRLEQRFDRLGQFDDFQLATLYLGAKIDSEPGKTGVRVEIICDECPTLSVFSIPLTIESS